MKMNNEYERYDRHKRDISFSERYIGELTKLEAHFNNPHALHQTWEWVNEWDGYALKYDDEVYSSSNMYILEM